MTPRLLTKYQAAQYCGYSPRRFAELVSAGKLPRPIPDTHRWDLRQIDRALDVLSGISTNESLSPYEQWKARHG
jgi:predicted DNA-binding transcriptional regulator AlpA